MFRRGSKTEQYFQGICGSLDVSLRTGKFVVDLDMDAAPNDLVEHRNLSRVLRMGLLYLDPPGSARGVLTDKGLALALVYCLKKKLRLLPKGQACLVIFDIPERKGYIRRPFGRFLRELGFLPVQKSVFITRRDVGSHLQYYLVLMKLDRWIRIYTGCQEVTPLKA